MSLAARKISYPYITTDPKIAGGAALLKEQEFQCVL